MKNEIATLARRSASARRHALRPEHHATQGLGLAMTTCDVKIFNAFVLIVNFAIYNEVK